MRSGQAGARPDEGAGQRDQGFHRSGYVPEFLASFQCESLGIKDDISKALYKEIYHSRRSEIDKGTVADKNSLAELQSQNEQLTAICYSRAYKMLKAKVEAAQELLSSAKKILSRRMTEMELTRLSK